MKTKKNITFLIENGLSNNVISKMSDNQVRILVEKFKKMKKEETKENWTETKTETTKLTAPASEVKNLKIPQPPAGKQNMITLSGNTIELTQGEMTEDETDNITDLNALSKDAEQVDTGQEIFHGASDMADDGMGDDSGENRSMMGMAESKIDEKFVSKSQQGLFWARCNKCSSQNCKWCKMAKEFSDSTSKKQYKNMPEKKHPEKTVEYKKKKTNENIQRFLIKKISEMVDKKIKPKMSKKDLIETIKKKNKSMIIRRPKKLNIFSNEAPMKLPIGKLYSIGKK